MDCHFRVSVGITANSWIEAVFSMAFNPLLAVRGLSFPAINHQPTFE